MTPEGRIKAAVKRTLKKYPSVYAFWPVQTGYGARTLDCLVCANGWFITIETKAPGKKPTGVQWACIEQIQNAGGVALVIDGPEGIKRLDELLRKVTDAGPCFTETQNGRGAGHSSFTKSVSFVARYRFAGSGDEVGPPLPH
jgi:hypothetical protein